MLTTNTAYGFFGSIKNNTGCNDATAHDLFAGVVEQMVEFCEIAQAEAIEILDSRTGRHLADAFGSDATDHDHMQETLASWFFDGQLFAR